MNDPGHGCEGANSKSGDDRAEYRAWPILVATAMRSGFWRDFEGDQDEALAELDAGEPHTDR